MSVTFQTTLAACLYLLVSAGAVADTPTKSAHEARSIEGFTVEIDKSLLQKGDALGAAAVRLLEVKLYDITRVVPSAALAKLRTVAIRLDREDPATTCACYHPSKTWLVEHGFDATLERHVHLANATKFLEWSKDQPSMVLHELAHAYHDQVLGYTDRRVLDTFAKAVASKHYESVLHSNGSMEKHYALSNEQEYFAETTEAWFGTNDMYPFVRPELAQFDPDAAKLMSEVWK
jgi:hypothetical protein